MMRFKDYVYLLVIIAALSVGITLWQRYSMAYGFEMIGPDDPIEKVVWLMGKPDDVDNRALRDEEGWVLEYNYLSPMVWLFGNGWSIRFDEKDRVVRKGVFAYD